LGDPLDAAGGCGTLWIGDWRFQSSCGVEFGLSEGDADGDGVPRRGVRTKIRNFAGERNFAVQKPAKMAIAEAGDVAELDGAMEDSPVE
jgi:hypothetical protein